MAIPEIENRRQSFRLARRAEHAWQLTIDDLLITKNIVDLSATGLAFKAPHSFPIEVGQTLTLNVSLKPGEDFNCQGRVRWLRDASKGGHTMRLFGVQFEQLPARVDSLIVKELYKETLRVRWEKPDLPDVKRSFDFTPPSGSGQTVKLLRLLLLATLFGAFIYAAKIYESHHPYDSIEYRFNQGLAKKLGHF